LPAATTSSELAFEKALADIAAGACERDRFPTFPTDAFDALEAAGVLQLTVPDSAGRRPVSLGEEWRVVRRVSAADASVGRVLDGHLNAVERLHVALPEPLRSEELRAVTGGRRRLGVWGADPVPGEGEPARLTPGGTVEGVKVFCSGAGGLDRALVLLRSGEAGPPLLAYVDLSDNTEVDPTWYRGAGMRASESHRVAFSGARVLAVLGEPGELSREPYFGRDAIRTAASWAGAADSALAALLAGAQRRSDEDLVALAVGRALTAQETIDALFERAAREAESDPQKPLTNLSVTLQEAVAGACRAILAEAERALGSRPFAEGDALDRARRDLGIFLLQHRLDPLVARLGRRALG
jgi:alkylation response protein AidB-like acyl-CoA dehydrogenase